MIIMPQTVKLKIQRQQLKSQNLNQNSMSFELRKENNEHLIFADENQRT